MVVVLAVFAVCACCGFSGEGRALELDESPAEPGSWGFRPDEAAPGATNPPVFCWRPVKEAANYRIEVTSEKDFATPVYAVVTPWSSHCPSRTFTPGEYSWHYAAIDANGVRSAWSQARRFAIPVEAQNYPKPALAEIVARVPKEHPRLFLRPEEMENLRKLSQTTLAPHWANILKDAERLLQQPPPSAEPPKYPEGIKTKSGEWKKIWWGNRTYGIALTNGAATLAFAYLISGDTRFGDAARDLVMAFAEWDPKGATQFDYNDEAAMPLLYYPSRAYTWAYDRFTEEQRGRLREVMRVRGEDCFNDLMRGQHLWTPYDSHDNREWHKLGELAVAFLGEIPEAEQWLDFATTVYFTCYPVWGGSDGGWSEGAAYWLSYQDRFMNWVLVSQAALGINPFDKPFFHQTGYYALYTLPPGTGQGAWGDQGVLVDSKQVAPLVAKLAVGARNPHWWWYAQQHQVDLTQNYFGFLFSAHAQALETVPPAGLPSSRAFLDEGIAVLNSNLLDGTQNVQIHFKSSPVGRQSHGYNANNAFLLYVHGKPMFILTGRRDVHGSPHHVEWIWDSKSDNAILVNGEGQRKHSWTARGKITGFKTTPTFDYVVGEAAGSYDGRLERWTRRILFFKPDVVVIHDVLRAPEPATYQWNLHAPGAFEIGNQRVHWKSD
ncbi:MAG: DUF4962 domain-containing protein, partial [Candidatus Hydrogenedentes bacterium]|nr:DUF4962 domain-containing protein [Candidatus Hydrogenedentota bacterium]